VLKLFFSSILFIVVPEINFQDPEISFKVNIGFALPVKSRVEEFAKRDKDLKTLKEDQNLERASRKLECKYCLFRP